MRAQTCACSNIKSGLHVLAQSATFSCRIVRTNLDLILLQRSEIKLVVNGERQGMMAATGSCVSPEL